MLNPIDVTIDESVLAAPRAGCAVYDLKKYAEDLMRLGEFIKMDTISVYMTKDALYSLDTEKDYSHETLRCLFDKNDECVYSSREILNVMKHIKEFILTFEKDLKVSDVDVSGDIKTDPKIENATLSEKRRLELKKCALMIAILLSCSDEGDPGHALVLRYNLKASKMSVEAKVCYIDSKDPKASSLPHSPDTFKGNISVFYDFSDVITVLKAINIMEGSIDKQAKNDAYSALFRKIE